MNRQDLAYVLDSDANDTLQLGERRQLQAPGRQDESEPLRLVGSRKRRKGVEKPAVREQDSPRSSRRRVRTYRDDSIEEESKGMRRRKLGQTPRQHEEPFYAVDYTNRGHLRDPNSSEGSIADLQRQRQHHQVNQADTFRTFSEQFYPQRRSRDGKRPPGLGSHRQQVQVNQLFENQYIKEYPTERRGRKQVEWQFKATKEGFLYFFLPGTNTYQWNFPVVYDPVSGRKKTLFLEKWVKKFDKAGKKYYKDTESGQTQETKPDSETYLIQAAMLGNIAFLGIYMKARGSLAIKDQRGRNALHHSVSHGHQQLTAMLCEFGHFENLVEGRDKSGNTPLFAAVKHNQDETLKVLVQYNCNLFHRNARGDTCLHIAAASDAQQSLVLLAGFVSEQLFDTKNRDGMTALDIAESLQHKGCVQTLTVLQRNVIYNNAVSQREHGEYTGRSTRIKSLSHRQVNPAHRFNQQHESSGSDEYERPQEDSMQNLDFEGHAQKIYSQRQNREEVLQHDREFKMLSSRRHRRLKKETIQQKTPPFYRQTTNPNRSHSLHLNESAFTRQSPVVNSSRIQESYFDDEMQARVSRSARQRERQFQRFGERDPADQQSALESAINQTQRIVSTIGSFVKYGYTSLIEFVWQDAPRLGSHRNRVMSLPPEHMTMQTSLRGTGDLSNDSSCFEFQYGSQHGQSRAMLDSSEESSASDYKTAFSRTRSRPNRSASRRRTDRDAHEEPLPDLSNHAHPNFHSKRNSSSPVSPAVRGHGNAPGPKNVHFAETSQADGAQQPMPGEPTDETGEQAIQEGEEVVTRSICIQAMPTKRRRRKLKAADLSKRSIGVGSMCIDDTTVLGDASKTIGSQGSGSLASKGRLSKQKKNQMTEVAKEYVKKRYLSSEDERRTKEESDKLVSTAQKDDLYSNSKAPYVNNQAQLLGIGKDQDAYQRQEINTIVRISRAHPSLPLAPTTQKQTLSRSPTPTQAPSHLTKAQLDIVNLNGQPEGTLRERSNSNSKYRIDGKTDSVPDERASFKSNQKIQGFYAKMALHEQMTEQSDSDTDIKQLAGEQSVEDIRFDPLEQDEENYEHQHENDKYFEGSSVEDNILADLRKEQLDDISACSFMPGHEKRETYQGASCMTMNQLDKGQFVQQSCASITHQFNQSSVGLPTRGPTGNVLPPSLNMVNYQSDSEAVGSRRAARTIPIPGSPALLRQTSVDGTKQNQAQVIRLFSEETEQKGLRSVASLQADAEDAKNEESEQADRSEPPSELFKGNETALLVRVADNQTSKDEEDKQDASSSEKNPNQVRTLLGLPQKEGKDASRTTSQGGLAQQKGVTRYLDSQDDSTFNFELSKDLSNTHIFPGKEVSKDDQEVFPPQNLHQPIEEQSQSTQALQLKQANKSTGSQEDKVHEPQSLKLAPPVSLAKGTNIIDELDSISQIYDQLETIQESIENQDRGLGIIPAETRYTEKARATPGQTANKQASMFYSKIGKGNFNPPFSPAPSSGPDEEAVLIGLASDQEVLDPRQFKYDKQNRSTTAALFNNHFLSSASEGEDDGNRKKIDAARQARRRQNPMAVHSSSVNNGAAPLYGQRLQKHKSINQIKYRPPSNEGASEAASNRGADPTTASDKGDSQSVSDRFKQSLQAFKLNKLIKPGSLNSSKQNTSVAMSQKSTGKSTNISQVKMLAKKTT